MHDYLGSGTFKGRPQTLVSLDVGSSRFIQADPMRPEKLPVNTRVCDRCITKKIKCDLKHPSCSSCSQGRSNCVYSYRKRKPGPTKGSRRNVSKVVSRHEPETPSNSFANQASMEDWSGFLDEQLPTCINALHGSSPQPPSSVANSWSAIFLGNIGSHENSINQRLTIEQQSILMDNYFKYIHLSLPLFPNATALHSADQGGISGDLRYIICAISAKVLGPTSFWGEDSVNSFLLQELETHSIEDETPGQPLALEKFRSACLLTHYAFHQWPGEKAWMRVSMLTRKAYQCGLHQIDNKRSSRRQFQPNSISPREIEDWRRLWWCIYCLDSYSSVTTATPFVTELSSVNTALLTGVEIPEKSDSANQIFLTPSTDQLWLVLHKMTNSSSDYGFSIYILMTTVLREAATIHRLQRQNPSVHLKERLEAFEDHFATIQLAFPPQYLSEARQVLSGESGPEYHARLLCILQLYITRIIIYLPVDLQEDEVRWKFRWQQNLEYCFDIVSVIKQWEPRFSSTVDPAVCFIVSAVLALLQLHSLHHLESHLGLEERISRHKGILRQFLEQFARVWNLPSLLIASFDMFSQSLPGHLRSLDVECFLWSFQGPLHQLWYGGYVNNGDNAGLYNSVVAEIGCDVLSEFLSNDVDIPEVF